MKEKENVSYPVKEQILTRLPKARRQVPIPILIKKIIKTAEEIFRIFQPKPL